MLWRGDADGRCVYLNRAMRAFWGLKPEDCGVFLWTSSLLEEDVEAVFGPFGEGMRTRTPFECEGRYRRHDGAVRILRTRAHPSFDADGVFLGMIGVNEDITEQRAAEADLTGRNAELADSLARLRSGAERFDVATRISGLAMSEHDGDLRYTWALNLPEDCRGKTPSEFVGDGLGGALDVILRRALETGETQSEEVSFHVGEQRVWCDIQAAPTTLADGRPGVLASALDVTARKLNEEKLQVLARELSHRVKNVFAVVQAVVKQSARATGAAPEFASAVQARLVALANAQDALLALADDRFELRALLERQLSHLSGVVLEGEETPLPGALAPYVALAVHELGTNALKYGSLSVPGGRVVVAWSREADGRMTLSWTESGGPPPPPETGRGAGFGSTLLSKVFASATGGETQVDLPASGLVWTARFSAAPSVTLAD